MLSNDTETRYRLKISGKQTTTGAPDNKHTNLQQAGWAGASEFYPGQQDSDSIIPLPESKQEMLIPAEQNSRFEQYNNPS